MIRKTYISIKFENSQELYDVFKLLFPNSEITPPEKLHTTLIYSSDPFVEIKGELVGKEIVLINPRLELLGERKDYLVLAYDNPLIQDEFTRLKIVYGLNHYYPVLLPHITLIENYVSPMGHGRVPSIVLPKLPSLIVSEEKSEPLIED